MANRFVVWNTLFLVILVLATLAETINMSKLAFTDLRNLDPSRSFISGIWDISINPTFLALMVMIVGLANLGMLTKGYGPSAWTTRKIVGVGLVLAMVCLLIISSSILVTPMIYYMDTTIKEVKILANVFRGIVVSRFLMIAGLLIGGVLVVGK